MDSVDDAKLASQDIARDGNSGLNVRSPLILHVEGEAGDVPADKPAENVEASVILYGAGRAAGDGLNEDQDQAFSTKPPSISESVLAHQEIAYGGESCLDVQMPLVLCDEGGACDVSVGGQACGRAEDVMAEDVMAEDVMAEDVMAEDVMAEDVMAEDVMAETNEYVAVEYFTGNI
ncbi:hypothetical protein EIP86_004731, partial [Pleurotus ostreatoroseus]